MHAAPAPLNLSAYPLAPTNSTACKALKGNTMNTIYKNFCLTLTSAAIAISATAFSTQSSAHNGDGDRKSVV